MPAIAVSACNAWPGVPLLQRDDHHQSMAMAPNALDVRDAGLLQMVPDARGVERNAIALGDRQKRRIAEQDRIIAIENPLDADDTFSAAMSVISRPFAEGPFRVRFFFGRGHFAFDDNFSCCRNRQSGEWRSDHFERRAAQRAGIFIFTHTGFGGGRRSQPGSGLATEHDGDGTGASRVPILRAICLPCLCSMIQSVTRSLATTQER